MQLNINEVTSLQDDDNLNEYNNELFQSHFEYEKIPENIVIKKSVHFADSTLSTQKPIHQSIPKVNAKMVRPQIPQEKPKISYEDILSKMGMFVSDGKLHLVDRNTLTPQKQKELLSIQKQQQYQSQQYQSQQYMNDTNIPNNSYIYNKFFKDELQPQNTIRKPRTLQEYKMMLVNDYIQRQKIKQMKSTKLIMPTSNINISSGNSANLNKLFSFSKR